MSRDSINKVHTFSTYVAEQLDVNCAIILSNLEYWISKNQANNQNYFDDHYWTYNSVNAFNELFPYLSDYQIRTSLKKLEDEGYILSGNYNKLQYDRTKWYAITKKGYSILYYQQLHLLNTTNGSIENHEPIPYDKPNSNTDSKPNNSHNEDINKIFEHWNNLKIIKHREMTSAMESAIRSKLKHYSIDEVIATMNNYNEILKSDFYILNYRWPMQQFLKSNFDKFVSLTTAKASYLDSKFTKGKNQLNTLPQSNLEEEIKTYTPEEQAEAIKRWEELGKKYER